MCACSEFVSRNTQWAVVFVASGSSKYEEQQLGAAPGSTRGIQEKETERIIAIEET